MKKLVPTTPLNDAIKRIASGDTGAASVIAMLNRERPQNIMEYLRALDFRGVYGNDVYSMFHKTCGGSLDNFIRAISDR